MVAVKVGEYRFTETDVRKTFHHALAMLDLYPPAARELQHNRRRRVAAAVDRSDLAGVWSELLDARHDLIESGTLPPRQTGAIEAVNASGGGVPKLAIERAEVGFNGLVADRQALCLWSREVIDGLRADGHPIDAGSAGENVTIVGLDWPEVRPGGRLRLGTVLCQITAYAVPCKQNARWFSDGDFNRIHHRNGPISRIYAVVIEPGVMAPGDAAVLEPD